MTACPRFSELIGVKDKKLSVYAPQEFMLDYKLPRGYRERGSGYSESWSPAYRGPKARAYDSEATLSSDEDEGDYRAPRPTLKRPPRIRKKSNLERRGYMPTQRLTVQGLLKKSRKLEDKNRELEEKIKMLEREIRRRANRE